MGAQVVYAYLVSYDLLRRLILLVLALLHVLAEPSPAFLDSARLASAPPPPHHGANPCLTAVAFNTTMLLPLLRQEGTHAHSCHILTLN